MKKKIIRTHATFQNLQLCFQSNAESYCLSFRAKSKTIIWPGRLELSSDETHRRKLWGQNERLLPGIESTNLPQVESHSNISRCAGGYQEYIRGYHGYIGRCSVHRSFQ